MPRNAPALAEADKLVRGVSRLIKRDHGEGSVLRHSLGQSPDEVAVGVHRIVVPLLPREAIGDGQRARDVERAYYAAAALIAAQPRRSRDQDDADEAAGSPDDQADSVEDQPGPEAVGNPRPARKRHNLGHALAWAVKEGASRTSAEGRLQLLARQDIDGLYRHLARLILHLRAEQVRIDWGVLTYDLARWGREPRLVAKEWAQEFYRTDERLAAEARRNAENPQQGNENVEE